MTSPLSNDADARLAALESEVHALRRSARRLRTTVAAFAIGSFVLLLAAATNSNNASAVVRTQRLEIVDELNRVIGLFAVGDGGGQLDIWNTDGTNAARLAGTLRGGDLSLWNNSGRSAVGLFASEGGGRAELYDPSGGLSARLTSTRDGGAFTLMNGLGKPGVLAAATDRGGGISACDSLGRPLAELAIVDSAGQLHLSDRNATTTALLYSTTRGGALDLSDSTGTKAFAAGADVGGGSFTVFSPTGAEIIAGSGIANGGGSLDVRNAAGKTVVRSFVGDDEAGRWGIGGPDGQPQVGAQGAAAGGTLALLAGGRRVVQLDSSVAGGRIETTDGNGQAGVVFGIDASLASGAISLRNDRGQEVLRAASDERGFGAIAVYNRTGAERRIYSVK